MFSFIKVILCSLLMLSSAWASNRQGLDDKIIAEVKAADSLSKLRVYVNKRLTIERVQDAAPNTSVNGEVDRVVQKKILKEILKRNTKGKIVFIFPGIGEGRSESSEVARSAVARVYVTFDNSCQDKTCALEFTRDYKLKSHYNRHNGRTTYYLDYDKDESYFLSGVPANSSYSRISLSRGVFLAKTNLSKNNIRSVYTSRGGRRIKLEFKINEYEEVIKQTRRFGGIE